jgi:hypothetical protein
MILCIGAIHTIVLASYKFTSGHGVRGSWKVDTMPFPGRKYEPDKHRPSLCVLSKSPSGTLVQTQGTESEFLG